MTGRHDARDRMVGAALELLHEGGWAAATTAAVAERAGAGKMSLYRHFDGRDELVAAALEEFDRTQRAWLLGPEDGGPRARLLGAFDRIAERVRDGRLTGCPFVTTRLQLADGAHPASRVAVRHKRDVAAEFARLLAALGHPTPEQAGDTLLMLLDGAIVHAAMEGDDRPVRVAARAAAALVDAGAPR